MTPEERRQKSEHLLGSIEVRDILDYYGFEAIDKRVSRKGGYELDGACPFHTTATMNFSINSRSGLWLCRSAVCGKTGDIIKFVALSEKCDYEMAWRQLCSIADIEPGSIDSLSVALTSLERGRSREKPVREPLVAMEYPKTFKVAAHPYLVEARGIDPMVCQHAKVGYVLKDPFYKYRVVLPIEMSGRLYSLMSRRVVDGEMGIDNPGLRLRYHYSGKSPISRLLYGIDDARGGEAVVIVEAAISVLRLRTLGLSFPAVAGLKADLSSSQIKQLVKLGKPVYLCLDNDLKQDPDSGKWINPGMKAAWKAYRKLSRYLDVAVVQLPPNRDPADTAEPYDLAEFLHYLNQAFWPSKRVAHRKALTELVTP